MKVAQVLDQMVSAREALFAHAVTPRYVAGILGRAHAVHRRLVALQVRQARELCGRSACGNVAGPCSNGTRVRFGWWSDKKRKVEGEKVLWTCAGAGAGAFLASGNMVY